KAWLLLDPPTNPQYGLLTQHLSYEKWFRTKPLVSGLHGIVERIPNICHDASVNDRPPPFLTFGQHPRQFPLEGGDLGRHHFPTGRWRLKLGLLRHGRVSFSLSVTDSSFPSRATPNAHYTWLTCDPTFRPFVRCSVVPAPLGPTCGNYFRLPCDQPVHL